VIAVAGAMNAVAVVVYDTAHPVPADFAARALEGGFVPHLVTLVPHPSKVAEAVQAATAKKGFATFRVLCREQNGWVDLAHSPGAHPNPQWLACANTHF